MELMTGFNKRLAAAICLVAFTLLKVVCNVHTHGTLCAECGSLRGVCIAAQHSETHHCAACDIFARGASITTFAPTFHYHFDFISESSVDELSQNIFTTFSCKSLSRAPPIA